METVRAYEQELSKQLISQLQSVPGLHIWGITDPNRLDQRVSTVSFTIDNRDPADIAKALGDKGIYVWNGNFYALEVTTTIGLESRGGLVRVGAVHYNTHEEINQLIEALCQILEAYAIGIFAGSEHSRYSQSLRIKNFNLLEVVICLFQLRTRNLFTTRSKRAMSKLCRPCQKPGSST